MVRAAHRRIRRPRYAKRKVWIDDQGRRCSRAYIAWWMPFRRHAHRRIDRWLDSVTYSGPVPESVKERARQLARELSIDRFGHVTFTDEEMAAVKQAQLRTFEGERPDVI